MLSPGSAGPFELSWGCFCPAWRVQQPSSFHSGQAGLLEGAANPNATSRKQVVAGQLTLIPPLVVALALWAGGSPFVGGFLAALFAFALLATLASRGLLHAAAVASQSVSPELKAEPRPVRLEAHSIEADEDNRRSDAPKLGAARNGPTPAASRSRVLY